MKRAMRLAMTAMVSASIVTVGNAQPQSPSQPRAAADSSDRSQDFDDAVRRYRTKELPKIVGGVAALDGEFPWQVSLGVAWIADPARAHFCGGTIYNARWIITAGHCVGGLQSEQITVSYGANMLAPAIRRENIDRIIRHPSYRWHPGYIENDIALLRLRDPLVLDARAQPLQTLAQGEDQPLVHNRSELVVTGWGATQQGGRPVADLRKVSVKFIDRAHCASITSYGPIIDANMLCAGVDVGGKDSCQGDSGGPLIWRRPDGSVRLAGVVSFGEGCAQVLKWGVYARVANFRDWIVQNTAN